MSDEKAEFGDERFQEYMNRINSSEEEDAIEHILEALKFEMTSISDLYKKSIDRYILLTNNDPIKEKLSKFIIQLIDHLTNTIDQFNFILVDIHGSEEEDEEEKGTDENKTDENERY